ncbi:hypothetical protein Rs2_06318 [Raphanus sativus]|nr:hypothetical protein Rs2_06318 [Raphanus sativus]
MDTLTCCDCGRDCSSHIPSSSNAKVQIENECQLLRETVAAQQDSIQDLYAELDEERNAASTAANEAMSMILRLQREKAEVEMELRQFKRFSEERMEHDRQELLALEDLVYRREQTIQALSFEAQGYRHRMMSYGVSEDEVYDDVDKRDTCDDEYYYEEYPPLKCSLNENPEEVDVDVEKYALTDDSPLKSLELRISQMEKVPSFGEKVVVVGNGQSPRRQRHFRKGVSHSGVVAEEKVRDDTAVDGCGGELNQPDPDIVKLYARMQALEADRESMRQAIVSMRTEKAQMVLLKEIAQHLSKDVIPERRLPLRKASIVGVFSFLSVFKWITSFVFWRKKARRSKYMNGVQGNNMGLEMLLENTPRIRQWRCLSSTQV